LGRLEADLLDLARPVPPLSEIPAVAAEPRAAWWGRVYVLEGSRLGAAVIAKCVQSSLGAHVPCRFLGEPAQPAAHAALLAVLECELDDPHDLRMAALSARAAFSRYRDDLDAFDGMTPAAAMGAGEPSASVIGTVK
jgi:heme oxygenase (biliverdin-IX-beta and delta-forming)